MGDKWGYNEMKWVIKLSKRVVLQSPFPLQSGTREYLSKEKQTVRNKDTVTKCHLLSKLTTKAFSWFHSVNFRHIYD